MKYRHATYLLPGVIALLVLVSAEANEAPALRHNPFSRPPSVAIPSERSSLLPDGTRQPLDLRATMVAATNALANVGGKVLRPGDEVQGYTLVKVLEDRAVFAREGSRLTVYVKPELHEEDE